MEFLFRTERMGVLLENDVIIMTIENIESDVRLFNMLGKDPAGMRDHSDGTVKAFILCTALYHNWHVVIVGVAVSYEQDTE